MSHTKLSVTSDGATLHITNLQNKKFTLPSAITDISAFNEKGPVAVARISNGAWLVGSTDGTTVIAKTTGVRWSMRYLFVVDADTGCALHLSLIGTIVSQLRDVTFDELELLYTKSSTKLVRVSFDAEYPKHLSELQKLTLWQLNASVEKAYYYYPTTCPCIFSSYLFETVNSLTPIVGVDAFTSDGQPLALSKPSVTVYEDYGQLFIQCADETAFTVVRKTGWWGLDTVTITSGLSNEVTLLVSRPEYVGAVCVNTRVTINPGVNVIRR